MFSKENGICNALNTPSSYLCGLKVEQNLRDKRHTPAPIEKQDICNVDMFCGHMLNVWFISASYEPRHEKTRFAIREQQRRRSGCASAQSDQRLCYSLLRYYNTFSLWLVSIAAQAGLNLTWSNPEDRFSHDEAQLLYYWEKKMKTAQIYSNAKIYNNVANIAVGSD